VEGFNLCWDDEKEVNHKGKLTIPWSREKKDLQNGPCVACDILAKSNGRK